LHFIWRLANSPMTDQIAHSGLPQVVIIGGGFGGIELAKKLRHKPVRVVLLDRNNYHTFQPLLYQVASGGLGADAIAHPFRKIFQDQKNIIFRMAEVESIDRMNKKVMTSIGAFPYDYLVLATGSTTNFFGNKGFEEWSMQLKTIPQALDLRSLILQEFEFALSATGSKELEVLMNFVVVGGGPTGVELAGALSELKRFILPVDYPELDAKKMSIYLVEAGDKLLGTMSPESSEKSAEFLRNMGVNVMLSTSVKSYDGVNVTLSDGQVIRSRSLIWSAGVMGATVTGFDAAQLLKGNRYKVDVYNHLEGHNDIFAIGDVAGMITEETPKGHPMVAPVAMQQAKLLSKNLMKKIEGKTDLMPFKYKDQGSMATVGRNKAVVDLPFIKFQGFFAWFVWMFVHLMSLVGFRNKLIVFINWMWNYLSYENAIRLIIRPFRK
jgi:NADH dehydrogenase